MPTLKTHDAEFFGTIHELLEEQSQKMTNRRGAERQAFECTQLLAPYDGTTLPNSADFLPVLCHDISPTGLSFYAPQRPDYQLVVVALGNIPVRFFAAEVKRITPSNQKDSKRFLVGCKFVQRLFDGLE